MLDILKFVQGAIARKDFVPALTHFHIHDRRILGCNGNLALSGPIALDLNISPKAGPFIKAIEACKETVSLHMTKGGRLSVQSGKFTAYIECTADPFPELSPIGDFSFIPNFDMLAVFGRLEPFIAEDASRQWAQGILLRGESAYATNNIALLECWLGVQLPFEINIPKQTISELLRIGERPIKIQISQSSITFYFSGDRWLMSQLYTTQWPSLTRLLDVESNQQPIPAGLAEALEDLSPLREKDDRIYLLEDEVTTTDVEDAGASIAVVTGAKGCYNIDQMRKVLSVAVTADLTRYPNPVVFYGDKMRGCLVGVRM